MLKSTESGCSACGSVSVAGCGVAVAGATGAAPKSGIRALACVPSKLGVSNCALAQPVVSLPGIQQIYHQAPSSLRESTVTCVLGGKLPRVLKLVAGPSRRFK